MYRTWEQYIHNLWKVERENKCERLEIGHIIYLKFFLWKRESFTNIIFFWIKRIYGSILEKCTYSKLLSKARVVGTTQNDNIL